MTITTEYVGRHRHQNDGPLTCIHCDAPAVTTDPKGARAEVGDRPGPKCQRHARPERAA